MTTPDDPAGPRASPGPIASDEPADQSVLEPDDEVPEEAAPSSLAGRFASISIDRYLPVVAIIGMILTYLQIPPYFALTFIAIVWLLTTRVTRNHRFLGLTLTEGLAWAATCLIALFVVALFLGATSTPA